jgi:hypothetical protein
MSLLPFAELMSLIWLTVWDAARQPGTNGAVAMVGRSVADLLHVSGADHR